MKNYELSTDAEEDLREVARYTLNKWGKEILQEYREGLKNLFEQIGNQKQPKKQFSENFPELLVAKYKYHYIFYLGENVAKPIIIGVIHERRDIVVRLNERLS
jgi:toxin ParE1/3/4